MINNVEQIYQNNITLASAAHSDSTNFVNSIFPSKVNRGEYAYSTTALQKAKNSAHKKVNEALAKAQSQVGNIENPLLGNKTRFISKYRAYESKNHKIPVENEYAYCSSFVSWCYGNDKSAFGYERYTPYLKEKAQKAGFYTPKTKLGNGEHGTYIPKNGDLVMWIYPDKINPKTHKPEKQGGHVGIIESSNYNYLTNQIIITTIEANAIPKGDAETAASKAKGDGPEGVHRKVYTLDELKQNSKMNGVVRMEDWLTHSALLENR